MPSKPKLAKDDAIAVGNPGEDEDFVFESSAGTIRLPSLATGPMPKPYAMARARADKDIMTMTVLVVRAKAGDRAGAVEDILAQLDEQEFEKFFRGWNEHSGVELGE